MADLTIPENVYDVIIIGGGPGGLTAGLYASRASMKVLLVEGSYTVSQITLTDMIENYPGLPGITGFELIDRFKKQALSFGLEIKAEQVSSLQKAERGGVSLWMVSTDTTQYEALSVIISTGAEWRHLGVPGEDRLIGQGVSFCATCDAPFYRNRDVAVVGGGDTAVQEALYLTKFADSVRLIHRRDRLRATGILQERAFANEKITFIWDSVVEEILGDNGVTGLRIRNLKSNDMKELPVDGVFLFIGLLPNTKLVDGLVSRDDDGYIIVDSEMRSSAESVFACGDCIRKSLRQVVTACGDGAVAADSAGLYVDKLKGQEY
ncbi:MAG TPA: thioredoxin-disulfide reductase [Deltaproteobacteria bacterium]|nr:thioredoxin-disulfide reductase [Deltaproteobacteria bacterium]